MKYIILLNVRFTVYLRNSCGFIRYWKYNSISVQGLSNIVRLHPLRFK